MSHFTSNTYILKRKILTFTKKFSRKLSKPERKFTADITYGMLASGSCLLTDVCDQLHEPSKKINVVDRLSRHLEKGVSASAASAYLQQVKKWSSSEPIITLMTVMLLSRMAINLNHLELSAMVQKVHPLKAFIKKVIM